MFTASRERLPVAYTETENAVNPISILLDQCLVATKELTVRNDRHVAEAVPAGRADPTAFLACRKNVMHSCGNINSGPAAPPPRHNDTIGSKVQSGSFRSRRALAITDNELIVIAALAQMGLISQPAIGNSTPAATGTPSVL